MSSLCEFPFLGPIFLPNATTKLVANNDFFELRLQIQGFDDQTDAASGCVYGHSQKIEATFIDLASTEILNAVFLK